MTAGRDNTSNQRQTQHELEALRNRPDGDDQQDVVPIGYVGIDGVRRTIPGDGESAFIKTPPFESDTARWERFFTVPLLVIPLNYAFTPPVDVTTRRLLNAWIGWTLPLDIAGNPNILSILPQGRRDERDDAWYTIGVVDPALTASTPTQEFGSRTFYQAELRTPSINASALGPTFFRTVLTFDVAVFTSFRLAVGTTLLAGTLLDLDYSFSD
jgi:hypothetical protein